MDFGVIGLGNHAVNRVMPAILESGNRITAVYSRKMEKAKTEGARYGAKPFDDLKEMIRSGLFDAAYIASPNFLHYEHAKSVLENDKHVLLEKPMTLRDDEAASLVELSKSSKHKLFVGFHMRFNPAVMEAREIVRSGRLGKIVFASGTWAGSSSSSSYEESRKWWTEGEKVGGGSIMGTGVHVLDTMNFIIGSHPESVMAYRNPEKEPIDLTFSMLLSYGSTKALALSSREVANPRNDLVILGTTGSIIVRGVFSTVVNCSLELNGNPPKRFENQNVYVNEIKGFVDAVKSGKGQIANASDGEIVVRTVNAAVKSSIDGKRYVI
ncbi:MAG: Gfo/Idh/MocA family oxidoreductase [Thermoplasmataceae archaeon]